MKRIISIILIFVFVLMLTSCAYDSFGHETYTDIKDYPKIFELTEIRSYSGEIEDLFPKSAENLDVTDFYCEWELGIVGSADVEIYLGVKYTEAELSHEINRLKNLGGGNLIYDTETFDYPAYVSMLGYYNTSLYALVDEDNTTVHYVFLQLLDKARIDIGNDFLPRGYHSFGEIAGTTYNVYESLPPEYYTAEQQDI